MDVPDNSESSISKDEQQEDENDDNNKETNVNVAEKIIEKKDQQQSSESEAPTSERAASGFNESPFGSPRVQFENIKEEESTSPNHEEPAEEDRKGRRHREHK